MEKAYLITEPFNGVIESSITINDQGVSYVDYSGSLHNDNGDNLTLADYMIRVNPLVKVVNDKELDQLLQDYEDSLVTEPKRIDQERFNDMLDVLPPCRWHSCGGFEVFHVSERYTGELVSWFGHTGDHYFEFMDYSYSKDEHLNAKLSKALKG